MHRDGNCVVFITTHNSDMNSLILLQSLPGAVNKAVDEVSISRIDMLLDKLLALSLTADKRILVAVLIYIAGRFVIKIINRVVSAMLGRRHVDVGVQSFLRSLVHILLTILLIISVISALGINTTSFAALLASAGVAVGMALSGNLQNFAGGLVILLFKPYRVGDLIEAQGTLGRVREIQIFHTILTTYDNKVVYIPNGSLSTSVVVNHSREDTRRVQWIIGVDYGQNIDAVRQKVLALFASDPRILQSPDARKPFVGVEALADSSVNLVVRVWVNTDDYWPVFYQGQQQLYDMFNREGINIPYPQQVVHVAKT